MKHPELNIAYFVSQGDSISYSKTLGRAIGILRASMLGQIIWWTRVTAEKQKWDEADRHFRDGHWWIWNTNEEWAERLYCLKERTIGDILRDLKEMNLIFSRTDMNEMKIDRTKWYAPNEEAINAFVALWDEMGRPIRGENGIRGEIKKVMDAWDKVKDDFPMIPTSLQDGEGPDDSDDENQNKSSESTSDVDCNIRQTEHGTYVKRNKEDTSDVTPITNTTNSTSNTRADEIGKGVADAEGDEIDDSSDDSDSHEQSSPEAKEKPFDHYGQKGADRDYTKRLTGGQGNYPTPTRMIQTIREVFPKMKFTKKQQEKLVLRKVKSPDGNGMIDYNYSLEELIHINSHFGIFVKERCNGLKAVWEYSGQKPSTAKLVANLLNVHFVNEKDARWHGWRKWFELKDEAQGITASKEPRVEKGMESVEPDFPLDDGTVMTDEEARELGWNLPRV